MIELTYRQAAQISFEAPEGIPDTAQAALTVYASGDGEAAWDTWPQSVNLNAAQDTLAADAAAYAQSLVVTDSSPFVVGRNYWLYADNGRVERIEVSGIISASDTLQLSQPIRNAASTGAIVGSGLFVYDLPSGATDTLWRRYRAVWSYTDPDGVTPRVHQQYFSVVREPFNIPITETDIESHDPAWGERVDAPSSWTRLIVGAHSDVARMLRARQLYPDLIRDRDGLKDAVIFCILSKFYMSVPGQLDRGDRWYKRAETAIDEVMRARTWYDENEDGALSDNGRAITLADGTVTYTETGSTSAGRPELGPRANYMPVG